MIFVTRINHRICCVGGQSSPTSSSFAVDLLLLLLLQFVIIACGLIKETNGRQERRVREYLIESDVECGEEKLPVLSMDDDDDDIRNERTTDSGTLYSRLAIDYINLGQLITAIKGISCEYNNNWHNYSSASYDYFQVE